MNKTALKVLLPSLTCLLFSHASQAFNPNTTPNDSNNNLNPVSTTDSNTDSVAYPGDYDPSQLKDGIQHQHRIQYYSVSPRNRQDLGAAINRTTPIQGGYHGLAEWNIQWGYRYQNQSGGCRIAQADITLDTQVLMPRLNPNQSFDSSITSAFKTYYDSLLHHEMGHLTHGILAANEVASALLNTPATSSCRTTGNNANRAADAIIQKYNRADQQYDRETQHGATQGARITSY